MSQDHNHLNHATWGVLGWSGVCHRFRSRDDGNQPRMKTRLYRPTTP